MKKENRDKEKPKNQREKPYELSFKEVYVEPIGAGEPKEK